MARHTQGDWILHEDNCGGGANVAVMVDGRPIVLLHSHAVRAPNLLRGRAPIETDEARANARIAAAGPRLAAALQEVVAADAAGWQAGMNGNAGAQLAAADRMGAALRRARAVLAALEGEG